MAIDIRTRTVHVFRVGNASFELDLGESQWEMGPSGAGTYYVVADNPPKLTIDFPEPPENLDAFGSWVEYPGPPKGGALVMSRWSDGTVTAEFMFDNGMEAKTL